MFNFVSPACTDGLVEVKAHTYSGTGVGGGVCGGRNQGLVDDLVEESAQGECPAHGIIGREAEGSGTDAAGSLGEAFLNLSYQCLSLFG